MDNQIYNKLTEDQRELLGTLFDTQSMRAIMVAGNLYQQDKAEHIALMAPDFDNVILNRGNIQGARFIYDLCKLAHSKMKKAE